MKKITIFLLAGLYSLLLPALYDEQNSLFAQYYEQAQESNHLIYTQPNYYSPEQSNYALHSQPFPEIIYDQPIPLTIDPPQYYPPQQSNYMLHSQQRQDIIYAQPTPVNTRMTVFNSLMPKTTIQTGVLHEIDSRKLSEEIYKNARAFVESYYITKPVSKIPWDKRLPELIAKIYDAKAKGMSEHDIYNIKIEESPRTALFYHSLKNYFLTTSYTQEKIIYLEKGKSSFSMLSQFPAYIALTDSLLIIVRQNEYDLALIAPFLSFDDKIIFDLFADASLNNNPDLVSEFYTKASDLLLDNDKKLIEERVYEIVHMIEAAQLVGNEYVLSVAIEEIEPDDSFVTKVKNLFDDKYSPENIKSRIKMLIELIAEYNHIKFGKLTPKIKQIKGRKVINNINIPLPEHVNNMLNDQSYAFDEFDNLVRKVESL